ncbi:hypothetical protein EW146_g8241 [Bondarzewia mesenterica]|uniref:Uncharacterized protein n=1 Tax=Bondarzewia mesenterica TaxID=1095465 RepID=A0A4S4LHR1_9AGAM|nr:hypothetical protein EW146_g8241 [Bondarzewia mesenterica]
MSIFGILGGGAIAIAGWYQTRHIKDLHLTKRNEVSLYVASVAYTLLAIISLFGLLGVIIKRKSFVSMYSLLVWMHLGFNVGTGAYFIYTLFHKSGDQDVNSCAGDNSSNFDREACEKGFEIGRGILVAVYVVFWLIELWGCLIVSDYVGQLEEEEATEWPKAATLASASASAPPPQMATTYNYGAQYAFATPDNSYSNNAAAHSNV